VQLRVLDTPCQTLFLGPRGTGPRQGLGPLLLIGGALLNQRTYRILGTLQSIAAQKGEAHFQELDELDSVDLGGFFLSRTDSD
ncbi:hypothetical protein, partial [Deinococcus saxicola]|uniref:hypothetical protein n=1 Tax=Deinococcus saxicola TaxID=249406 RepID=UPI003D09BEB1